MWRKVKIIACIFLFSFLLHPTFSYERVPVTLEFKEGGTLHTFFYCFNDIKEGKKIAEDLFHVKNYEKVAGGKRERMIPVPLGTNVGYYDWAIFCYGYEFWFFEVKRGFLWGSGMMLSEPRS
ncbi:hypothetical protein [Treponema sp.]|jgi:hypothetical protein|uniref:hypothetical protein n=1 Tax=Treponema sp. TaxID=166 RepID=UPI0025EABC76|nr:hypothetical protein [Treponema sp.]MBR4322825.1 hypothetical protein [Treponema sp.]